MSGLISDFIFFFTVIDPIGTVPVFIAATAGVSAHARRRIAVRAALVAGGLLIAAIVLGQVVLERLEIDLAAFRVAGGVILFLFALSMIFGESKPEHEIAEAEKHQDADLDAAIYPLAIPSIAGPGAIVAVILQTDNSQYTFAQQSVTAGVVVVVVLIAFVAMLLATRIQSVIGDVGASIVSRVMGLLFAGMAANEIMSGIADYYGLAVPV